MNAQGTSLGDLDLLSTCKQVQATHMCMQVKQKKCSIPNKHQHRQHKDGNLDGRAKSHSNGQVHLVLVGDQHGSDVLTGIASNGQDDKTQKGFTQSRLATDFTDGIREKPAVAFTLKTIAVVAAVSLTGRSLFPKVLLLISNDT